MQGRRNTQSSFSDLFWADKIPKDSCWAQLRAYLLSLDESIFEPLFSRTGRPSISPIHTFGALLMQVEHGWSDREFEGESRFDDRCKYALGATRDFNGIDAVTLCDHRARFFMSPIVRRLFAGILGDAEANGFMSKDKAEIIDSFMVWGAGAVQDTYTMLRKGIVRLLRMAGFHELESELGAVLKRQDYAINQKPKINWGDREEKRLLLESYVIDARNLVAAVRALNPLPKDLGDAADLLERIAEQDIEEKDGSIRMKKGTAKDRVISVTDPEMRHGHKTSSAKTNGYKTHIMTDGNFVTAVVVTGANEADARPFPEVMAQCQSNGVAFDKVLGDSAYHNMPIIVGAAAEGIEIITKVPSEAQVEGRYPKSKFEIDTEKGTVTCPAGAQAEFDPSVIESRKGTTVSFSGCAECPRRTECTSSRSGRTVSIHPYEPEIAQERKRQATQEFKAIYAMRSAVERIISNLTRHGGRQARFFGAMKVRFQEILVALNHNIKTMARLIAVTG